VILKRAKCSVIDGRKPKNIKRRMYMYISCAQHQNSKRLTRAYTDSVTGGFYNDISLIITYCTVVSSAALCVFVSNLNRKFF